MSTQGRTLVFPMAIGLGARPLTVPGRGNVLVVSSFYAFRLADGAHVRPAQWYDTVASHVGADAIPDSMLPLPGAELMVLGRAEPLAEERRDAAVRCGAVDRRLRLQRDPLAPEAWLHLGAGEAVWHDEFNPVGRGGPNDDRVPLIVDPDAPEHPVWLGATPFDHPVRIRRAGTPDAASGAGWPPDADPAVLHDAHPALCAESLHPGDPIRMEGLVGTSIGSAIPPYRITITSGRSEGTFVTEAARIHTLGVIPSAGLGAMIWRCAIDVGEDILGEKVEAIIAAVEDAGSEFKDPEHWTPILIDRWLHPDTSLDDRRLLPPDLAKTVVLPFALPEGSDTLAERHAAAEAWAKNEMGVSENPFDSAAPEETGLAEQAIEQAENDEEPPDANKMAAIADQALAASRRRHAEAGFGEPPSEEERVPEARGAKLDREIRMRIADPFQAERERRLAGTLRSDVIDGLEADDVLERLAKVRLMSPGAALPWPAMEDREAATFGAAVVAHLAENDLDRYVDVSGARFTGDPDKPHIVRRQLDGLLAEQTTWRDAVFDDCGLSDSSFSGASFIGCTFRTCRFERTNLSNVELVQCEFIDCTLAELQMTEPTWFGCRFVRCTLDRVNMADLAVRDIGFENGTWSEVNITSGIWGEVVMRNLAMESVTFAQVHAPQCRIEQVRMDKVSVAGNGFNASVFEDVTADTCGFLSYARFDKTRFSRVRFSRTGFTNAVFAEARFDPGCDLEACDLSGAMFFKAVLDGVHFIDCTMVRSLWMEVSANEAWFHGSRLRGVDLRDARLAGAVFTDADLEGVMMHPDRTIGADFRGTVRDLA